MNNIRLLTLIFACCFLPVMAGSGPDKNDGTTPPMFLLGSNNGMMQMVYWCFLDEPKMDEEYPEYYKEAHQAWELQEQFRRNASKYTKLIVDGNKTLDVKFVDEIFLNPDGEKLFPGELHGMPKIPSPGARFTLQGESNMNMDDRELSRLPQTANGSTDYGRRGSAATSCRHQEDGGKIWHESRPFDCKLHHR